MKNRPKIKLVINSQQVREGPRKVFNQGPYEHAYKLFFKFEYFLAKLRIIIVWIVKDREGSL